MGCVFSQTDLRRKPGLYKVFNVDDQGHEVSEGYIDISGSDLILFQDGREPIRWPLRCLRRYGYEDDLFSFESGRRCPTGAGIYAFKCNRTESLFTNLQESILRTGQDDNTRYNRPNQVSRASNTNTTATTGTNTYNGATPRQGYTALFACRSRSSNQQHEYMNGGIETISAMRLRPVNIVELPEDRHDYMNTGDGSEPGQADNVEYYEEDLAYENVELGAAYCNVGGGAAPPPPRPARDSIADSVENAINYIQLVVGNSESAGSANTETTPPPDRDGERYAQIDFAATEALSKSNIQSSDEGCRRTRHNGTLSWKPGQSQPGD